MMRQQLLHQGLAFYDLTSIKPAVSRMISVREYFIIHQPGRLRVRHLGTTAPSLAQPPTQLAVMEMEMGAKTSTSTESIKVEVAGATPRRQPPKKSAIVIGIVLIIVRFLPRVHLD